MGSRKKKADITTTITSEDHFLQHYNENNKKLIVVDVFPGWSGPCTTMFPTYNQLMLTIDDFEKRIEVLLLDQDKLTTFSNDKLHSTCKPKFVFISGGRIIDEVSGNNIPSFLEKVNKYIPLDY